MDKNELKQLRNLKREIDILQELINKIPKEQDKVYGSSAEFPYQKRGFVISGYSDEENTQLARELESKKRKLMREMERLTNYIYGIDDSQIRQVLILRFVEGRTWDAVAAKMGYGYTKEQLRKKVERFLAKN